MYDVLMINMMRILSICFSLTLSLTHSFVRSFVHTHTHYNVRANVMKMILCDYVKLIAMLKVFDRYLNESVIGECDITINKVKMQIPFYFIHFSPPTLHAFKCNWLWAINNCQWCLREIPFIEFSLHFSYTFECEFSSTPSSFFLLKYVRLRANFQFYLKFNNNKKKCNKSGDCSVLNGKKVKNEWEK
jgi:hypothetical protein